MLSLAPAFALSCLPPVICYTLARKSAFFAVPPVLRDHAASSQMRGTPLVATMIGCLAVVPLMLLALGTGAPAAMLFGALFSTLAALWGGYAVAGVRGVSVVALLAAAAIWAGGPAALWAANLCSVCAGLGGGHLLAGAFPQRALLVFCVAFVVMDILVVGGGLLSGAVNQLPLAGSFGSELADPPLFNRVETGGVLLGAGDITFAALVAMITVGVGLSHRRLLALCGVYLLAMWSLVAYALISLQAVPATLPGLVALAALFALGRANIRAPESAGSVRVQHP